VNLLSRLARRPGPNALVAFFLLLLTVFRFWYAGTHQLVQDEAYYWQWARHLDWGYYDNTPLVALVIRFFITLLGSTQIGVRAGAIVSSLIAAIFIYLLAKRLLGFPVALMATLTAGFIPLFAAGGLIMTQDPVHVALFAATLYVVHRALTDRPTWLWWLGAGVLAGLTIQAKLNGLLLLPSIFLYLLLSPTARNTWLRRPQPYVAGLVSVLIFSPFVWWNHTHDNAFWIHIGAMGSRHSSSAAPLEYVGNFLGAQAALLSPLIFLTYLYSLYDGWRRGAQDGDDARLFLWCPSIVVFGATVLVSLRSKVEGNWAVAAYVTGMILVADLLWRAWQRRRGYWAALNLGVAVLVSAVILFPSLAYGLGFKLGDPTQDRTNELYGWRQMADRVGVERAAMGGDPFVFGVNYRMPSEAAFYLPGQPQTYSLFLHDRANEYRFWEKPTALIGRNAVFINDSPGQDHFDAVRSVFRRVVPEPPLEIMRDPPYSKPIRVIQVVRCYDFLGYDPHRWQWGW
jgi:4-amino-4-deoxy-L-arabinose transferase-like glycosyltransferase